MKKKRAFFSPKGRMPRTGKEGIGPDTVHIHVGYIGPERLFADTFIAGLGNKDEGKVNQLMYINKRKRDPELYCEMDAIHRLFPSKLHSISQDEYFDAVIYGKPHEVLANAKKRRRRGL